MAAERREHDGERVLEECGGDALGGEPPATADDDREPHVAEHLEDGWFGEAVDHRVEREPREPLVVGELLDVLGVDVVGFASRPQRPETARGVPGAVDPGERDERALDGEPCDGVVRREVPSVADAGGDHCLHDARLVEFALEPLGLDVATAVAPPDGVEPRVDVDDPEAVTQLQHHSLSRPPTA